MPFPSPVPRKLLTSRGVDENLDLSASATMKLFQEVACLSKVFGDVNVESARVRMGNVF